MPCPRFPSDSSRHAFTLRASCSRLSCLAAAASASSRSGSSAPLLLPAMPVPRLAVAGRLTLLLVLLPIWLLLPLLVPKGRAWPCWLPSLLKEARPLRATHWQAVAASSKRLKQRACQQCRAYRPSSQASTAPAMVTKVTTRPCFQRTWKQNWGRSKWGVGLCGPRHAAKRAH
jgi:hypothetical protein